jgi:hypothetical protein
VARQPPPVVNVSGSSPAVGRAPPAAGASGSSLAASASVSSSGGSDSSPAARRPQPLPPPQRMAAWIKAERGRAQIERQSIFSFFFKKCHILSARADQ